MKSIRNATHVIKLGVFLASLDMKDAFYFVPTYNKHLTFLKFLTKGKLGA